MEAKELMIGDWVQTSYGNIGKVIGFDYYPESKENDIVISYGENVTSWSSAYFIKPIHLTEEILLKNGFILDEEWGEYRIELNKTYFSLEYTAKKESCYIIISTYSEIIKIKYVHELQHLLCLAGMSDLANNFKIV